MEDKTTGLQQIAQPETFTIDDLCKLLEKHLAVMTPAIAYPGCELIQVIPLIDYMISGFQYRKRLLSDFLNSSDYCWVEAVPSTGGSEGVYLDVKLVTQGSGAPERWPIITAKTLEEGPSAYAAMGMLGGLITYLIEDVINRNYY